MYASFFQSAPARFVDRILAVDHPGHFRFPFSHPPSSQAAWPVRLQNLDPFRGHPHHKHRENTQAAKPISSRQIRKPSYIIPGTGVVEIGRFHLKSADAQGTISRCVAPPPAHVTKRQPGNLNLNENHASLANPGTPNLHSQKGKSVEVLCMKRNMGIGRFHLKPVYLQLLWQVSADLHCTKSAGEIRRNLPQELEIDRFQMKSAYLHVAFRA